MTRTEPGECRRCRFYPVFPTYNFCPHCGTVNVDNLAFQDKTTTKLSHIESMPRWYECSNCHASVSSTAKYCHKCGLKFSKRLETV